MVIWKERQHELDDLQESNDPVTLRALHECGILKFFWIPGMRSYVWILEHMIRMWDSDQHDFVVGIHTLIIYVEDIYFLTVLSRRGRLVTLTGPQGGEGSLYDLIDDHCSI